MLSMTTNDMIPNVFNFVKHSFPSAGLDSRAVNTLVHFLHRSATQTRPLIFMALVGCVARLVFSCVLVYFDLVTDLLTARAYYFDLGRPDVAFSLLLLLAFEMMLQMIITWHQYKNTQILRQSMLLCLCNLAPFQNCFFLWTGKSIEGEMQSSAVVFGVLKVLKVS